MLVLSLRTGVGLGLFMSIITSCGAFAAAAIGRQLRYALTVALFIAPLASHAQQELKILDPLGLTRLQKKTAGRVAIIIQTEGRPTTAEQATLSNVDGVAADRPGELVSEGTWRFRGVAPGTWIIRGIDRPIHDVDAEP